MTLRVEVKLNVACVPVTAPFWGEGKQAPSSISQSCGEAEGEQTQETELGSWSPT